VVKPTIALLAAVALLAATPPANAAFPGQNGKIAFVTDLQEIWTVDPDGSDLTRLTSLPGQSFEPAWSADGRKIAFTSHRDGNYEIYVMNADGSDQRRITMSAGSDFSPAWSPDGTKIAFNRDGDIWTTRSDGTDQVNLTNSSSPELEPAWSPDGSTIAFSTFVQLDQQIWTMNADGTGRRSVISGAEPTWSPDGREIWGTYEYEDSVQEEIFSDIFRLNPQTFDYESFFPPGSRVRGPAVSPDNNEFVFYYDCCSLQIMTRGHEVRDFHAFGFSPDWQPTVQPPDCSGVTLSRSVLTTVNRRLAPVTLDGATDPDGDPVTLSVDGVTQDEPVVSRGDPTSPDVVDEGEGELRVRAERNPRGDGRVYRIAFTVADDRGESCSGTATVSVPRKKRKPAVDSAPPSYDSFGG
jgi:dipeptidyl aminopeptidase/acylaminoacyl peptidase